MISTARQAAQWVSVLIGVTAVGVGLFGIVMSLPPTARSLIAIGIGAYLVLTLTDAIYEEFVNNAGR